MSKIKLDNPKISQIGWEMEPEYSWVKVGTNFITDITHEEQYCGEYSIHWLVAWSGKKPVARYNARNIDSIIYEEKTNEW